MTQNFKGRSGGIGSQGHVTFQIESRACMIFGLWLAEKLGFKDSDMQIYARDIITANLEEPGLNDVLRKARKDVAEKSLDISDHILERKLEMSMSQARKEILGQ